jgi:formamidopyrimidine-DNA glycosylase
MPELPEVEAWRLELADFFGCQPAGTEPCPLLSKPPSDSPSHNIGAFPQRDGDFKSTIDGPHRRVVRVETLEQGGGNRSGLFDDIVFTDSVQESAAREALLGRTVKSVGRKGKHLWIELDGDPKMYVLFHFGMTGSFVIKGRSLPEYKSFKITGETWPPKYTKLEIELQDITDSNKKSSKYRVRPDTAEDVSPSGDKRHFIAFCDPRRLGRIRILRECHPLNSSILSSLAPDPLIDGLYVDHVKRVLSSHAVPIKALLLDQTKVCCGIGNWVADEVLFQAGIDPRVASNSLSLDKIDRLVKVINEVLATASKLRYQGENYPSDWLFHSRWNKGKRKRDSDSRNIEGEESFFFEYD